MAENIETESRYGWRNFKPKTLQWMNNTRIALFLLSLSFSAIAIVLNVFTISGYSTLEKVLKISSVQTGLLNAVYEIALIVTILPISYIGGRIANIRVLAAGTLLCGIGCLLFSLPHFLTPLYVPSGLHSNSVLLANTTHINNTSDNLKTAQPLVSNLYAILLFSMVLMGIGNAPLYPLQLTYIYENISPPYTPIYLGIYFASTFFGLGIGFALQGYFLQIPVDLVSMGIGPEDPRFVGAWWLGFLLFAFLILFTVLLILGFPDNPRGPDSVLEYKVDSEDSPGVGRVLPTSFSGSINDETRVHTLKEVPHLLYLNLTNPVFMLMAVSRMAETWGPNSVFPFIVKYYEHQFGVSASTSSILIGSIIVPVGTVGLILGGIAIRRYGHSIHKKLQMILLVNLICLPFYTAFLLKCGQTPFAGVNKEYPTSKSIRSLFNLSLVDNCNLDLQCSPYDFDPACGLGVNYFSPCMAGCHNDDNLNCDCVATMDQTNVQLSKGFCSTECGITYLYFPLLAILVFLQFFNGVPYMELYLELVHPSHKALGIAILSLFIRIGSNVPAPIFFGRIIDSTCQLYESNIAKPDSKHCIWYNAESMSTAFFLITMIPTLLMFCLQVCAFIINKRRFRDSTLDETAEPDMPIGVPKTITQETIVSLRDMDIASRDDVC